MPAWSQKEPKPFPSKLSRKDQDHALVLGAEPMAMASPQLSTEVVEPPAEALSEVSFLPSEEVKEMSASSRLLHLLRKAAAEFSDLKTSPLSETSARFKRCYARDLVRFEQRRAASPRRQEMATFLAQESLSSLYLRHTPLSELTPATPLPIEETSPLSSDAAGWIPEFRYRQQSYSGFRVAEIVTTLASEQLIGHNAAVTLSRSLDRLDQTGGRVELTGERFAILGAGSEVAPTRLLLEAGATVLWCDIYPPPPALHEAPGRLLHAQGQSNLLTQPDRILATLQSFAREEGPFHLGLFAYAPGKGREWRLSAAMNAVVRALPKNVVRSVGLYISPTSVATLEAQNQKRADQRWKSRTAWQRALVAMGRLRPNQSQPNLPYVADSVVPIQGASYQAAQYIEKTLSAEALEALGHRVSGIVAPITRTRSLEHPVFKAAFRGASLFGVETFPPEATKALCTLLYLEDILGETKPTFAAPRHFDGGVFSLPFSLEGAIQVAAARGFLPGNRPLS